MMKRQTVNTWRKDGGLYDESMAHIVSDGIMRDLWADHSRTVNMSGGFVSRSLYARQSSTVNMSGERMQGDLFAVGSSVVNISGGELGAGGSLLAKDSGLVTLSAREFHFGTGLSLDDDRVLGAGHLGGEWFDGTRWAVNITANEGTIRAIPEPSSLMLIAVALAERARETWRWPTTFNASGASVRFPLQLASRHGMNIVHRASSHTGSIRSHYGYFMPDR